MNLRIKALVQWCTVVMLFLIAGWLVYDSYFSTQSWENPPEKVGTRDLIAFWGGVHVWMNGGNPYDFDQLFAVQTHAMPSLESEQYFLNPPWALTLFFPLMVWPFQVSRILWLIANLCFLVIPGFWMRAWYSPDKPLRTPVLLASIALFLPSIMLLWFGQLSLFVYFFLVAGFHQLRKHNDFWAGVLFVPVTLKPHLLYCTLFMLTLWCLSEKRVKPLIGGAVGLVFSITFALLWRPSLFSDYLHLNRTPMIYKSSTFPTFVRIMLEPVYGYAPTWPVYALPLFVILLSAFWYFRIRKGPLNWDGALPLTVGISMSFAPYAWMYDYSILLLIQVPLVIQAFSIQKPGRKKSILTALVAVQAGALLTGFLSGVLMSFVWFPVAMLLCWLVFSDQHSQCTKEKQRTRPS